MTLPAHEVRCLDTGCPERAQCRRFLDRATNCDATTGYIATCWQLHSERPYPGYVAVESAEPAPGVAS
jgi:hypothetical protein